MTGEKDISSRLGVKKGGKLISKTLSKSSSPPSISAPPKAAVGTSKVKKYEVQRPKNSFNDIFKGPAKEKDSGKVALLNVPVTDTASLSTNRGSCVNLTSKAASARTSADKSQPLSDAKSAKIEVLETLLAIAKEETAALRQEVEMVKQDAQASIDISRHQAAEFYRQAAAEGAIHNAYNHQDSNNDMDDCEELLVNQNTKLHSRLKEVEDQLIALQQPEIVHNEEEWDVLTLRLHEAEKESNSRLQQLLSLKSSISSLTRAESQASDSELANSFSQLANRAREWVVTNYRRTKMDFDDLPEATVHVLRSVKANYWEIGPANKLALYQAIVSCIVMQIFKEPLLVGMPDQDIFAGLLTFSRAMQHAGDEFREWRRTTFRLIESNTKTETIFEWKVQILEELALKIEGVMRSITTVGLTAPARSTLVGIMMSAADLQRTLCLQKALYSVVFFDASQSSHVCYEDRTMESINDLDYTMEEDGELGRNHKLLFCVFPCLEKVEHGVVNIVFKARVCRSVR